MGGSGLIVSAITIYADLFGPEDRARYAGLFGALFVISSVAGPLLGGVLTDTLGWRWVFYVNVPVGALAFTMAAFALRLPRHSLGRGEAATGLRRCRSSGGSGDLRGALDDLGRHEVRVGFARDR